MSEVTASGNAYYGSLAAAVAYLSDEISPAAAAFVAALSAKQQAALVSAARVIDRQRWIAEADTFAKRAAILAFQQASYELGAMLLSKPSLFDAASASSNIESVTAGPTSVTFFGPTEAGRFPTRVQELLGSYLVGAASTTGGSEALGGGECAESQFDDCDRYGLR